MYAQLKSFCRLFIDDFLVLFAWIIILSAAILWQVEGEVLYESYAISAGLIPITPFFLQRFNTFMRCLAPLEILFYSALWSVKFSFMAFFYRLSSKVKHLRNWWYIVLFATVSVYIASIGDIEYKCSFGGIDFIISESLEIRCVKGSGLADARSLQMSVPSLSTFITRTEVSGPMLPVTLSQI